MRLSLDLGLGSVVTMGGGWGGYVASNRVLSLRSSQTGFGSPVDQSNLFNDPQLNTTLFPATWQASQTVAANAYRAPTVLNGNLYKATAGGGGATGLTEPTWPTTVGGTVVDGAITWTCERGPWQTRNTYNQICSVRQALLPASGAYVTPAIDWNMAGGDSLVIAVKLAWNFASDTRTDTGAQFVGNRHNSVSRSGVVLQFDGAALNGLRVSIGDGTNFKASGANSAAFTRKPGDGNLRTFVATIDGQTKRMNNYADGVIYQQSDMFDGANLAGNDLDLSTVTGSTATANNFYIGAVPGSNSYDFGFLSFDLLTIPGAGFGSAANRQSLVDYIVAQL